MAARDSSRAQEAKRTAGAESRRNAAEEQTKRVKGEEKGNEKDWVERLVRKLRAKEIEEAGRKEAIGGARDIFSKLTRS